MDKPAATFDVFCTSPEGYDAHYQLSGDKVFDQSTKLLKALKDAGFTPRPANGNGKKSYPRRTQSNGSEEGDRLCPTHKVVMKQYSNDRGAWHAHKLPSGEWCNGPQS